MSWKKKLRLHEVDDFLNEEITLEEWRPKLSLTGSDTCASCPPHNLY
jgi:hypothetical protein